MSCSVFLLLASCASTRSYDEEIQFTHNWLQQFGAIENPEEYEPLILNEIHYFEYPEYSKTNRDKMILKAYKLMMSYSRLFPGLLDRGNFPIVAAHLQPLFVS